MRFRSVVFAALPAFIAGCAHPSSTTPVETGARIAGPLSRGDCVEARRRAALQPDLEVERIPSPLAMKPSPFQNVPESALRKDGSAEIRIDVVVDTLGHADMQTFKVVKVSNKWFTTNVRSVIGKWTFAPALLAGCKVPRVYHFMSSLAPHAMSAR